VTTKNQLAAARAWLKALTGPSAVRTTSREVERTARQKQPKGKAKTDKNGAAFFLHRLTGAESHAALPESSSQVRYELIDAKRCKKAAQLEVVDA
jgi:hypothetical protein